MDFDGTPDEQQQQRDLTDIGGYMYVDDGNDDSCASKTDTDSISMAGIVAPLPCYMTISSL